MEECQEVLKGAAYFDIFKGKSKYLIRALYYPICLSSQMPLPNFRQDTSVHMPSNVGPTFFCPSIVFYNCIKKKDKKFKFNIIYMYVYIGLVEKLNKKYSA